MNLERFFKLESRDGSPVRWGVNQFPDGQVQFWIEEADLPNVVALTCSLPTPAHVDVLYQMSTTIPKFDRVRITYLYGARSDKSAAGSRVVANVADLMLSRFTGISSQLELVSPHCEELVAQHMEAAKHYSSPDAIKLIKPLHPQIQFNHNDYDAWIFPDTSAKKRFGHLLPASVKGIVCEKERDQVSGNIIKHQVPAAAGLNRVLVIDDLCDGGRTFIEVANSLQELERLDLYVTHGVFSNDASSRLYESGYDNIYVTNSLPDVQEKNPALHVLDVWES